MAALYYIYIKATCPKRLAISTLVTRKKPQDITRKKKKQFSSKAL